MAVYKRTYKAYAGPPDQPMLLRFLVVQRYAFQNGLPDRGC